VPESIFCNSFFKSSFFIKSAVACCYHRCACLLKPCQKLLSAGMSNSTKFQIMSKIKLIDYKRCSREYFLVQSEEICSSYFRFWILYLLPDSHLGSGKSGSLGRHFSDKCDLCAQSNPKLPPLYYWSTLYLVGPSMAAE